MVIPLLQSRKSTHGKGNVDPSPGLTAALLLANLAMCRGGDMRVSPAVALEILGEGICTARRSAPRGRARCLFE